MENKTLIGLLSFNLNPLKHAWQIAPFGQSSGLNNPDTARRFESCLHNDTCIVTAELIGGARVEEW